MTEVITFRNLAHAYRPGTPVLRGINLSINQGDIVAIIGLSGAGKSTLLRCINGLVTPNRGECRVLGEEVSALKEAQKRLLRRRIGMIFQEFNLVDRSSVLKNVLVGRLGYCRTMPSCFHRFSKDDIRLALDCIGQVGLAGFEQRRARDLSGGQKQRIAIARALAQNAEIVLADEATANLDVLTKDEIMALLCDLVKKRGASLVLSMHDLALAKRYCNRIVGLRDGIISFDAVPDDLDEAAIAQVLSRSV